MLDFLPDEVLVENIFVRLPTKSILQCMRVCKSWYSLVTSPNFIATYFRSTVKAENSAIFFAQLLEAFERFLFLFDNQDYFRPMSLHLPYGSVRNQIVGSVNGLICISIGERYNVFYFILFNPSIGHFLSIPPPNFLPSSLEEGHSFDIKCLGFDETTQDYKILYFSPKCCFIYSLNSKGWRRLITPPVFKSYRYYSNFSAVFVNGGIHWFAKSSFDFIMVFDVKGETFDKILLPESLAHSQYIKSMTEFGDSSIAIIEQNLQNPDPVAHVWVMKEYGLVGSWIKLATVDLEAHVSKVLGLRNMDEVLVRLGADNRLRKRASIVSRSINNNLEDRNLMGLGKDNAYTFSRVYKYVPSLVLLDKPNNINATFATIREKKIARRRQVHKEELELRRSKRTRKPPAQYGAIV